MSAVAALPAPLGLPGRSGPTFGRVLAAEWSKAWGLRSTRWAVAVMVLLTVGISFLGGMDSAVGAEGYGSLAYFVTSTLMVTQFPLLLLGVLLGSGELSSRSAGPTFVAVPTRTPVILAKALVTTAVAALTAAATLGLSAAAVLATPLGQELSTGLTAETTRMWLGSGSYLVAATVLCFGLGTLLRRSSTAVVVAFVVFAVEIAQVALPEAVRSVVAFLPGHASTLVTSTDGFVDLLRDIGELPVGPWASVAVTGVWALLAVVAAVAAVRARDV